MQGGFYLGKYLFFDLDDTLIKCSGYFYDVEDEIANKILEYNVNYSFDELKYKFNEKQIENSRFTTKRIMRYNIGAWADSRDSG